MIHLISLRGDRCELLANRRRCIECRDHNRNHWPPRSMAMGSVRYRVGTRSHLWSARRCADRRHAERIQPAIGGDTLSRAEGEEQVRVLAMVLTCDAPHSLEACLDAIARQDRLPD